MSKNGYDSFFKAAKKAKISSGIGAKKIKTPSKDAEAVKGRTLSEYSDSELRRMFGMPKSPVSGKPSTKNKRKRARKKLDLSLSGLCLTTALMGLSAGIFIYGEDLESLVSRVNVGFMSVASAADQEKKGETKGAKKEKDAQDSKVGEVTGAGSAKETVEENISYFSKLKDRKKELDLREAELEELEKELHKQKSEIEARIEYLERVRRDIAGVLQDRVELDEEKVKKLIEVYSSMKPAQAATLISSIDEDLAVGVLAGMKKKSAAAVLNLMEPKKAQTLSEKYAGYRKR